MARDRRSRARAQLVGAGAAALVAGGALGACAWDEGVVIAPTTTTTTAEAPAEGPPPPPEGGGQPGATTTTTAATTTRPPAGARSYTVKPGDTMYAIAQAHGISLEQLVAANSGADPGALTVGQVLVIPPGAR